MRKHHHSPFFQLKEHNIEPANDNIPTQHGEETCLWRAVITQACVDATTRSQKDENIKIKKDALAWLSKQGEDFDLVCELANLDPDYVYERLTLSLQKIRKEEQPMRRLCYTQQKKGDCR